MPTVTELALFLAEEQGESTTDADYLKLVRDWIKDGFREIGDETAWEFMRTFETLSTVASTVEYSLSTTVSQMTKARFVATDEPIFYVTRERLADNGADFELIAKPKAFYQSGYDAVLKKVKIKLWPVPDGIYVVEVFEEAIPVELSDTSDIPMPPNFLTILKDYVRMEQTRDDKDTDLYDRMERRYLRSLEKRRKRFTKQPARKIRLRVSDITISRREEPLAKLPPNHFAN